jgi:hypothetical protein
MMINNSTSRLILLTSLVLATVAMTGLAWAQGDPAVPAGDHNESRQQVREIIDGHPGMDEAMRDRMQNNLERCMQYGMTGEEVHALFPGDRTHGMDQMEHMLSMQDLVLGLADGDFPIGPMMEKIMEGRMKNVPANRLEHVLDQTQHNIRHSHQMMMGAIEGGVQAPSTRTGMHNANSQLSHCLWDGLTEEGMDQIRERAMDRAHDGSCSTDDFVAACQTATQFNHGGISHDQAVQLAGEAMHHGYSASDMRTMGYMMMTGSGMEGHHAEMMNHMHGWIQEGMTMDEMTHHMMEGGWMGPADMMGAGGHHGMDNMGMSGPGHDGGMHGDDDGGHDGGHGGGHGGGM